MKKSLALLLVFVMLLGIFASCGNAEENQGGENTDSEFVDNGEKEPEKQEEKPDETLFNVFTGEYNLAQPMTTLPLGAMICNDNYTNSQPGLDTADMYLETETEGGITRIMAVYADASRTPELLGPMRSGRTPFIQISRALGIVYIHAGGSPKALQMVQLPDVNNVNILKGGIASVRDSALQSANCGKFDHCLAIKHDAVVKGMEKSYKQEYTRGIPWTFLKADENPVGSVAQKIDVTVSSNKNSSSGFLYDEATGKYTKYRGKLSGGKVHKATDGTPVEVSNIVVLFADKFVEQVEKYTRIDFNLEKGSEALVFSKGTVRNATYDYKTTGMQMFEEDGSALKLATGKTYVFILANSYKGNVTYTAE